MEDFSQTDPCWICLFSRFTESNMNFISTCVAYVHGYDSIVSSYAPCFDASRINMANNALLMCTGNDSNNMKHQLLIEQCLLISSQTNSIQSNSVITDPHTFLLMATYSTRLHISLLVAHMPVHLHIGGRRRLLITGSLVRTHSGASFVINFASLSPASAWPSLA